MVPVDTETTINLEIATLKTDGMYQSHNVITHKCSWYTLIHIYVNILPTLQKSYQKKPPTNIVYGSKQASSEPLY